MGGSRPWLVVLVVGLMSYLVVLLTTRVTDNANLVPALIVIGAGTPPATMFAYAHSKGRPDLGAARLICIAAISAVVSVVTASLLEDLALQFGVGSPLTTALIEEPAKLIVPAVVWRFLHTRRLTNMVVISVAGAAGFGCVETMGYATSLLLHSDSLQQVDQLLLIRGALSPARHVAWTGLAAAALWRSTTTARPVRTATLVTAGLAGVILLHALWDTEDHIMLHAIIATLSVSGLLLVLSTLTRQNGAIAAQQSNSLARLES